MNPWQHVYPRPQLRRDSFHSLCDAPWTLNGQPIRLPFPPQSKASGYQGIIGEKLHYETVFTLPAGFCPPAHRVLLHFGAVDQLACVSLNGQAITHHEGGYLPFCADVTDALLPEENRLIIDATDKLDRDLPYGKQSKKPGGMWYTPVSGIWQHVWLEAVPRDYIRQLRITPDLTGIDLTVDSPAEGYAAEVVYEGQIVAEASWSRSDTPVRIDVPQQHRHLWTPDTPHLYDLVLRAGDDVVHSYFALRTVEIKPDHRGVQRVCLNGQPIFLSGVLDQGYFPDGIFLPGDPQEFQRDILRMKKLGFNLLRKHVKIEPEIFYHTCDRLGMLVMQDMVNNGPYSWLMDTALPTIGVKYTPHWPLSRRCKGYFEQQAGDTVTHLYNHPCIIAYTIFNEGWGQFDSTRLYRLLRQMDPTRFYDTASGWFEPRETDVDSRHVYFRNKRLQPRRRPMLLSECGGYARAIPGHLWKPEANYGYGKTETAQQLTAAIATMYQQMVLPAIPGGLCGVIYTQLCDVEEEINGLYTYDRQVCKVDKAELFTILRKAEDALRQAVEPAGE